MPGRRKAAAESYAEARTRHERARADAREIENARLRGDLMPAAEVVEGWQAAIGRARSLLLGVPPSAADELVALVRRAGDDRAAERAVRERLAEMIHDSLVELANTAPDEVDEDAAAVAAA
jgi:phage terminase Nu1 subunit (DNA packaging protein)